MTISTTMTTNTNLYPSVWTPALGQLGLANAQFNGDGEFSFALEHRYLVHCFLSPRHLVLRVRIGTLADIAQEQRNEVMRRFLHLVTAHARERREAPSLSPDGHTILLQRWFPNEMASNPTAFVSSFDVFVDAFFTWKEWWQRNVVNITRDRHPDYLRAGL